MKKENLYRTSNFHIAAWLMMNDISLKEVEWNERNRATFVFDDFDDRDTLVQDFFKQEQLQKYISSSQKLKARMYAFQSPAIYDRPEQSNS